MLEYNRCIITVSHSSCSYNEATEEAAGENMAYTIRRIRAREILASGAYPTVEASVELSSGAVGCASVPYGASAGSREASVLVDNGKRYGGKGARRAVRNIEQKIAPAIIKKPYSGQQELDAALQALDPTPQKTKLGGNSILAVSIAFARAAATQDSQPLYRYLRHALRTHGARGMGAPQRHSVPGPMMVVIEGGRHADQSTDFQEYLICPLSRKKYTERLRIGIEVYHAVKAVLRSRGLSTNVGTEGAFAPSGIRSNEAPLKIIMEAIERAGYVPGKDVGIALDPAASEFFKNGSYVLSCEGKTLSAAHMIRRYKRLAQTYPIISIEDGLAEDDWEGWQKMYQVLGNDILVVGDDLTVSQKQYLERAVALDCVNAVLIKPNQAGTVSETLATIAFAIQSEITTIVSHRGGGDTNDTFIMDLAVAAGSLFTKVGPSRGERVEKYNRMLRIAEELGA